MNDTDVLTVVRESLSGVHMDTPVEAIVATARTRRRRRRMLGGGAVALAVGVGLVGTLGGSSPTPPRTAQLAAYTFVSGPTGATSLILHKGAQYRLDPVAFREALAAHGIPAVVTVGSMCGSNPEPLGLDSVVKAARRADGEVFITIDPAALPAGAELSIGYYPNGTRFALITEGAAQICS